MKKLIAVILAITICIPLVSCTLADKNEGEEFVVVDITMDNYRDYIDFVTTDTAIDIYGNPIEHTCVVITSKVYDDGLYFISSEDSKWDVQLTNQNKGIGSIGNSPLGTVLEDANSPDFVKFTNIQGKYKFVKSEYVEEYIFEDGIRKITLKDGRCQEIIYEGISAVDFSHPY